LNKFTEAKLTYPFYFAILSFRKLTFFKFIP